MLGVDEQQLQSVVFEYIPDWHPVNARRLHRHGCDLCFAQPLCQCVQLSCHASEEALFGNAVTVRIFRKQAGSDYLLVHVQTAAVAMGSHGVSPLPLAKTPALKDSP